MYRDPTESRRVNALELEEIRKGGGVIESGSGRSGAPVKKFRWADLGTVLSNRKLWGIYIGQYADDVDDVVFPDVVSQLPRRLPPLRFYQRRFPDVAGGVAAVSRGILRRAEFGLVVGSVDAARRFALDGAQSPDCDWAAVVVGIIGANYVTSPNLVVLFLTIAFFGNGFASITWVLVSSLAPKRLIGLTGGVFNLFGNLPSITVPIVLGLLVRGHDFRLGLVFIGCMGVLGALSYVFIVGRIERVEE